MSEEESSVQTGEESQNQASKAKNNIDNPKIKITWSIENEDILVNWCDTAQCYKWLHSKSHGKYSSKHAWYTIPAIILSTISGTASFAQEKLPLSMQSTAPIAIGSINIFIGILTTIQQYLKISELNEAHRVASIAWDKYQRNIKIELAKHPTERSDCRSFIKHCRQEYDRLMETAPPLDDDIIKLFINTFRGREGSPKNDMFKRIRKPDICDEITTVADTRHKWFELETLEPTDNDDDNNNGNNAILKTLNQFQQELKRKEESLKVKEQEQKQHEEEARLAEELKKKRRHSMQEQVSVAMETYRIEKKHIDDYVTGFKRIYERPPTKDEIDDYFTNENPNKVSPASLDKFIQEYDDQMHLQGDNNV